MIEKFDIFIKTLLLEWTDFQKTYKDLPKSRPYGFWISPDGRYFYTVPYEGHEQATKDIMNYYDRNISLMKNAEFYDYPYKNTLTANGYVKVVFEGRTVWGNTDYYDYDTGKILAKNKPKALQSLLDLADFYRINEVILNGRTMRNGRNY